MDALKPVERKFAAWFKKLPALPEDARTFFATYIWVFVFIGAVITALVAFLLLISLLFTSDATTTTQYPANIYSVVPVQETKQVLLWAWLAWLCITLDALILGHAVSRLKAMSKAGWNLIFLSSLILPAYSLFAWLRYKGEIEGLMWQLFGIIVLLYVLFQIRDKFSKVASRTKPKK